MYCTPPTPTFYHFNRAFNGMSTSCIDLFIESTAEQIISNITVGNRNHLNTGPQYPMTATLYANLPSAPIQKCVPSTATEGEMGQGGCNKILSACRAQATSPTPVNAKPASNNHYQQGQQHPSPMCTKSTPTTHQKQKYEIPLESRTEGDHQAAQGKVPCTDDNPSKGMTKQSIATCLQSCKKDPQQSTKAIRSQKKI